MTPESAVEVIREAFWITLVTGLNVLTNIAGQFPAFALLTLSFAPEPGSLLLLLAGAAGLVALGRSKKRD